MILLRHYGSMLSPLFNTYCKSTQVYVKVLLIKNIWIKFSSFKLVINKSHFLHLKLLVVRYKKYQDLKIWWRTSRTKITIVMSAPSRRPWAAGQKYYTPWEISFPTSINTATTIFDNALSQMMMIILSDKRNLFMAGQILKMAINIKLTLTVL